MALGFGSTKGISVHRQLPLSERTKETCLGTLVRCRILHTSGFHMHVLVLGVNTIGFPRVPLYSESLAAYSARIMARIGFAENLTGRTDLTRY
jgi:hypothetical protein